MYTLDHPDDGVRPLQLSVGIPCHRAVGSKGELTAYRWGVGRKRTLLTREAKN
jgi:AraC family transcriptional regulator of adaptative response/methylated-DNA-[protein]-cysteine methyltransferase